MYTVCKQGRDDIIVKINLQNPSLHLFTLQLQTTVDREIFTIKKFSPVAWAGKIKRAQIKYTYTHFTAEPSGSEN